MLLIRKASSIATASQDAGYFRLRIRDSKLETIFSLKEFRSFPNQFGGESSWTGLGPGQTPLLVRDISTQEIYALDVEPPRWHFFAFPCASSDSTPLSLTKQITYK